MDRWRGQDHFSVSAIFARRDSVPLESLSQHTRRSRPRWPLATHFQPIRGDNAALKADVQQTIPFAAVRPAARFET